MDGGEEEEGGGRRAGGGRKEGGAPCVVGVPDLERCEVVVDEASDACHRTVRPLHSQQTTTVFWDLSLTVSSTA